MDATLKSRIWSFIQPRSLICEFIYLQNYRLWTWWSFEVPPNCSMNSMFLVCDSIHRATLKHPNKEQILHPVGKYLKHHPFEIRGLAQLNTRQITSHFLMFLLRGKKKNWGGCVLGWPCPLQLLDMFTFFAGTRECHI